jgi:hypothetical protein
MHERKAIPGMTGRPSYLCIRPWRTVKMSETLSLVSFHAVWRFDAAPAAVRALWEMFFYSSSVCSTGGTMTVVCPLTHMGFLPDNITLLILTINMPPTGY